MSLDIVPIRTVKEAVAELRDAGGTCPLHPCRGLDPPDPCKECSGHERVSMLDCRGAAWNASISIG